MDPRDWSRIQQGIFAGESGGDYGALFGYQNRPNGRFSGVDLTKMTVDQALDFANPSGPYGQYVKGQVGRVATPMGAYQIVGTTLRAAKEGLGLRGDEVLTPAMQDKLGQWIYKTQGTGAWEGYKPMTEGQAIAAETMSLLGKGPQTSTKGPQMMQEQKPQGLLGSLGIQKRDEAAGGETALPFYQRDTFKDTAAVLAQGFGRMGIMGMEEIADSVAKQRTEVKAKNKTMEALMKMGTPQAQAAVEYINAGGDPVSALKMAFERPKAQAGVAVGDRLVNPVTGEVIYEDAQQAGTLSKDQLSGLNSLRDDLRTELKPFEIVKSGYNNITTFYNNPSATSDYALAVAFAKILDPGSVAREGEVAAVQNAGARIPALGQALKNAVTGEGQLTQEVRQQIAELATKVYTERQGEAQKTIAGYGEIAQRAGLPAEFLYSGSIPEAAAVVPAVVPPNAASQGVTQAEWDDATPEEKKAWLE